MSSNNGLMLKIDLMGGPMDGDTFVTAFHGRDEYKLSHRDRKYRLVYRVVGPHLPFPEHALHSQHWQVMWGGAEPDGYEQRQERFVPPTTVAVFAGYEDTAQKRSGTEHLLVIPPTDDDDDRCECGCEDDDE